MLASGAWYTSGTIWTAVGTIAVVAGIVVAVVLWRLAYPRRSIMWYVPVSTSLLTGFVAKQTDPTITVNVNDEPVNNPYFSMLVIESMSRRDISNGDFNENRPLTFNLGASIATSIDESGFPRLDGVVINRHSIQIRPRLIRKGELTRFKIITDGRPDIEVENPLIDVDV